MNNNGKGNNIEISKYTDFTLFSTTVHFFERKTKRGFLKIIFIVFITGGLVSCSKNSHNESQSNSETITSELSVNEWLYKYGQALTECYSNIPKIEVPINHGNFDPNADFMAQSITIMEYPPDTAQKVTKMMQESHPDLLEYLNKSEYRNALIQQNKMAEQKAQQFIDNLNSEHELEMQQADRELEQERINSQRQLEYTIQMNKRFLNSYKAPEYVP